MPPAAAVSRGLVAAVLQAGGLLIMAMLLGLVSVTVVYAYGAIQGQPAPSENAMQVIGPVLALFSLLGGWTAVFAAAATVLFRRDTRRI